MKYRLNLYTERFRPRQILLNRWLLCASVGLLFMTLLVAGFALGMSNAELAQRYHSSRDSQETLQSRLVSLSRQIDGDARKQDVERNVRGKLDAGKDQGVHVGSGSVSRRRPGWRASRPAATGHGL